MNFERAFEIENGLSFAGGSYLFSGESNPVGIDAPVGSFYVQKLVDGIEFWQKTGPLVGDWSIKGGSGSTNETITTFLDELSIEAQSEIAIFLGQEIKIIKTGFSRIHRVMGAAVLEIQSEFVLKSGIELEVYP